MIVTQRLRITPLSDEEMEQLIALEPDPELRVAYSEMREAALREPEQPRVRQIQAETAPGNYPSLRVLQKAGFRPTGRMGEEGPRFRWEP